MREQESYPLQLLGNLAVRFRMLDAVTLEQALQNIIDEEDKLPGEKLVELGLITKQQLNFLISAQQMKTQRCLDVKFGRLAVENGFVSEEQIQEALQRQKQLFIEERKRQMIGDILLAEGLLTEEQRQSIIAAQGHLNEELAESESEEDETVESGSEDEEAVVEVEHILGEGEITEEEEEALVDRSREMRIEKVNNGASAVLYMGDEDVQGETALEMIRALIHEHQLVFGLKDEAELLTWLNEGDPEGLGFVIAEGVSAAQGREAEVRCLFNSDPLNAGKVKDGGVIDFRDRGHIPQVAEGDPIAELIPEVPGSIGTDVHGNEIAPPKVKEVKLLAGAGVAVSEDGLQAMATVSGTPSQAKTGTLFVFPVYKIDGDVGLKTGHVDFEGDIQVNGIVEKDFRVRGGKLTTNEIEAAEIDIKGDIFVKGGIIGARIRVGGNLVAAYIHDSVIESDGDIIIKKEIIGSDIKTLGGVFSASCIILDSRISAKTGVLTRDIGSDTSSHSDIEIGVDRMMEDQKTQALEFLEEGEKEAEKWRAIIDEHSEENEEINQGVSTQAQIQDSAVNEQRNLNAQISELEKAGNLAKANMLRKTIEVCQQRANEAEEKLNALFARQDEIEEKLSKARGELQNCEANKAEYEARIAEAEERIADAASDVYLKVTGVMHEMTYIRTTHARLKAQKSMKALMLREKEEWIKGKGRRWIIISEPLKM